MRERGLRALLVILAAPLPAAAQGFPGEAPRPPAFPATVSLYVLGGWTGNRALRTYDVGVPNPNDPACDTIQCRTLHGLGGAGGVGGRVQVPVTRRIGLRFALEVAGPKPRTSTLNGNLVRIADDRITALRGEALFLFRLRPQAPMYFGAGGTVTRWTPGAIPGHEQATDVGAAIAAGYDHALPHGLGLRFEWTGYFMAPESDNLPTEYEAKGFAFDHQFSIGVWYLISPPR
jgi:hypothetical protein